MANLSEEARRRRFVAWMQVCMGGLAGAASISPGLEGGLVRRGLPCGAALSVRSSTGSVVLKCCVSLLAASMHGYFHGNPRAAGPHVPPPSTDMRSHCAQPQRRGHVWSDIRGLLHALEKEDSRRKLDGED